MDVRDMAARDCNYHRQPGALLGAGSGNRWKIGSRESADRRGGVWARRSTHPAAPREMRTKLLIQSVVLIAPLALCGAVQARMAGVGSGGAMTAPGTSGLPPATSGLAPATSGLAPSTSGLAPPTTGLPPTTTGLAPATSGLPPSASGLAPEASGLAPGTTGLGTSTVPSTGTTTDLNTIPPTPTTPAVTTTPTP
jgi:hypothetical protein